VGVEDAERDAEHDGRRDDRPAPPDDRDIRRRSGDRSALGTFPLPLVRFFGYE
jgi:hypothetical protein